MLKLALLPDRGPARPARTPAVRSLLAALITVGRRAMRRGVRALAPPRRPGDALRRQAAAELRSMSERDLLDLAIGGGERDYWLARTADATVTADASRGDAHPT